MENKFIKYPIINKIKIQRKIDICIIKQAIIISILLYILACTSHINQAKELTINQHQKIEQHLEPQKQICPLTEKRTKPLWIVHPPHNDHILYGIGVAPRQNHISNQVQAAKILAMRDISQQISVYISSLYEENVKESIFIGKTAIESHTKITSEALLQKVKIIDQWNDVENCNIYVLASVELIN